MYGFPTIEISYIFNIKYHFISVVIGLTVDISMGLRTCIYLHALTIYITFW